MSTHPDRWALVATAAAALAVDPDGLHGLVLRDRPGPVRDAAQSLVAKLVKRPVRRLPGGVDAAALTGGVDLVATIGAGHRVETGNVLSRFRQTVMIVPMAERMAAGTAARLASAIDTDAAPPLLLLDESAEPDESPPEALSDRISMIISLHGMHRSCIVEPVYDREAIRRAHARLQQGISDGEAPEALLRIASSMSITSLRAPLLALRLARVLAALDGCRQIGEPQIANATVLCLVPRALTLPEPPEQAEDEAPPPPDKNDEGQAQAQDEGPIEDRIVDAVAAMLPDLGLINSKRRGSAQSGGSGDRQRSASHGRPVRSRPGRPDSKRLDVFATLLNAAPWQPLRRKAQTNRQGLIVLPDDFRIKQYDRPSESVMIFLVDASGSQAAARMAEAKGAVELMLAEAYRRREKVALIAFRGNGAELLLPPTRSLVQAKKRLSVLPGGGPTPLAAGLSSGRQLAAQVRRNGATPYLVVLTDGRGNIGLNGDPGRAKAAEDSTLAARSIAAENLQCVLVDTANRPQLDAQKLAKMMDAHYLPLPRADARGINRMVRASIGT